MKPTESTTTTTTTTTATTTAKPQYKVYYKEPPKETPSPQVYEKPSYREPIQAKQPPSTSYRPLETSSYQQPVETSKEPTESSFYYKPYETEEDKEFTPGPVYYKPIGESTTTSTPAPTTPEDTVATAPKAPTHPPFKKGKLSFPPKKKQQKKRPSFLKFPKLPKPQPLKAKRPPPPLKNKGPKKPPIPTKKASKERPLPKIPPKRKPAPSRKGVPPPPLGPGPNPHKTLLGGIKNIVKGHKKFLINREGNSLAQSTAVLLPYVFSFL